MSEGVSWSAGFICWAEEYGAARGVCLPDVMSAALAYWHEWVSAWLADETGITPTPSELGIAYVLENIVT